MRCVLFFILVLVGCASRPLTPVESVAPSQTILIHVPGISGTRFIDRRFAQALVDEQIADRYETFNWNQGRDALGSLMGYQQNRDQAARLARYLTELDRAGDRIVITSHSGGTGIAVWALEQLPEDVSIDALVLLAPALSQSYDLSAALGRVEGPALALISKFDGIVLGAGTRVLGTIDRQYEASAGQSGFTLEHPRLTQIPYDPSWMKHGHLGDHIGMMWPAFAREVIAPMLHASSPIVDD